MNNKEMLTSLYINVESSLIVLITAVIKNIFFGGGEFIPDLYSEEYSQNSPSETLHQT